MEGLMRVRLLHVIHPDVYGCVHCPAYVTTDIAIMLHGRVHEALCCC